MATEKEGPSASIPPEKKEVPQPSASKDIVSPSSISSETSSQTSINDKEKQFVPAPILQTAQVEVVGQSSNTLSQTSNNQHKANEAKDADKKEKQIVKTIVFIVAFPILVYSFYIVTLKAYNYPIESMNWFEKAAYSLEKMFVPKPKIYPPLGIHEPAIYLGALFFVSGIMSMLGASLWLNKYNEEKDREGRNTDLNRRHKVTGKVRAFNSLFARDLGGLTFDVATHSDLAEITEYRGFIHWQRDVIEKFLSWGLTFVFCIFLGQACQYLFYSIHGVANLEAIIRNDIKTASLVVGYALIADGIILVASMCDAPGIGRTLDSLIVVLSGVVILILDPIKIFHNHFNSYVVYLVFVIAILFAIRWVIRHHTLGELYGKNVIVRHRKSDKQ